tara:strand:- start:218 stop:931 length:714 start_codon:yes stop_codon:yes gene_type:complete
MEIITRAEAKAQGLKRYFTGKPCKHGHVSERWASVKSCICCANKRKAYMKKYRQDNKINLALKSKVWREENKGILSEKSKKWRATDKAKLLKKEWNIKNKDKVNERVRSDRAINPDKYARYDSNRKDYKVEYRKRNPAYNFMRKAIGRIESNWKGDRTKFEIVNKFTYEELKHHLESLWASGMSWDNRSEWHIDHIKPIAAFIKEGITDPAIINALSNLQPLWAKDNLSKGAKYHET